MIVYHTSKIKVEKPDIQHSRSNLDFGRGFYVPKLRSQALKYADRFILRKQDAVLNAYELSDKSKSDALKKLRYEKINHQICFLSQYAIDLNLNFISSEDLQ